MPPFLFDGDVIKFNRTKKLGCFCSNQAKTPQLKAYLIYIIFNFKTLMLLS